MAKVFKISAYIVDPIGEFNKYNLADTLEYGPYDIHLRHINIDEADLGEWDDDHPLNWVACPKSEFEKYFNKQDELTLIDNNKMLWVNGEHFRCHCGGNVFSEYKTKDNKRVFECHSCGNKYEGE